MIDLYLSGGVMMWPLLALAAGVLWLAARTALRIGAAGDPEDVERGLHGILFWGAMAVMLGFLGTIVGLMSMMEAIARAGSTPASLVWGGVGVSLVTLIFGLAIFVVSAVTWFAIRQWHAAVTTTVVSGLVMLVASGAVPLLTTNPVSAQPPQWHVFEERRVGPPSAEFASITDVALDDSGRLWIVDGMAGEVFLDEAGKLRRVARSGQGPGELTPGAVEIVRLPGDTMLVVEPQSWRLHRFAPDGAFVRSSRIAGETGMTGQWHYVSGGGLAARIYPASVGGPSVSPAGGDPVRTFDLEGRAGDILAMLPPTESFRMGAGPLPILTLLAPQPVWSIDIEGQILIGSTHAYEVRAVAPDGTASTVVEEPLDAKPVGREMEGRARELLRESLMERRTPPPVVEQMVEAAGVSEHAPVLGGVLAGPDRTVWVQLAASTSEELVDLERPGSPSWRVYDESGGRIANVTLPKGVRVLGWSGERLVGITLGELGEPSAVVLRLERGG
ncbi:MAG: MotA/TolQ/ExbB proton channel family protein [Gemmatimonadota bacterium]